MPSIKKITNAYLLASLSVTCGFSFILGAGSNQELTGPIRPCSQQTDCESYDACGVIELTCTYVVGGYWRSRSPAGYFQWKAGSYQTVLCYDKTWVGTNCTPPLNTDDDYQDYACIYKTRSNVPD